MKQKFEHQRIENETKLPLRKSLSQQVIWILVGIMNHWGKNDRNHKYQDSNDSASTPILVIPTIDSQLHNNLHLSQQS